MYDLIVKFNDGERIIIQNVKSYGRKGDMSEYYIEKNDFNIFVPVGNVKYIGRKFDLLNMVGI